MQDSAVACQMMGFVVHPTNWLVYENVPSPDETQPIWRSNVECTSLDSDIMECIADDQFDHSCNHSKDVYVRCVTPTWAGYCYLLTHFFYTFCCFHRAARGPPLDN